MHQMWESRINKELVYLCPGDEETIQKYGILEQDIYNMDETGF